MGSVTLTCSHKPVRRFPKKDLGVTAGVAYADNPGLVDVHISVKIFRGRRRRDKRMVFVRRAPPLSTL
eukprot:4287229-Pyramimonas_sp.AAC.1